MTLATKKEEHDDAGSNRTASGILTGKRSLAYRVEGNQSRNLSSRGRGHSDEGLRICKEAERRAYEEVAEALELSGVRIFGETEKVGYAETGGAKELSGMGPRDEGLRISKESEKRAYQDVGEALNLALGHGEFVSGDDQAQYAFAQHTATTRIRAAHAMHNQASSERSLASMESAEGFPMPSLRRSQPAVFNAGRASADESELRQPAQRVVKIQPQEGGMRPGAYAHTTPRRFSDLTLDTSPPSIATDEATMEEGPRGPSARRRTMDVLGASFNDEDALLELSGVRHASTERRAVDSVEGNQKSQKLKNRCACLIGIVVLVVVAISAGVGVALSLSGSDDASPTPVPTSAPTEEVCSLMEIEEECSDSTTGYFAVIPECLVELREDLLSRLPSNLGVNATTDGNVCSAENLAMLSVAIHTSNEDSQATMSNRLGLSLLFYATNGRRWHKGSDWVSSKPHCEWHGVRCNEPELNVIQVLMPFFNMEGHLPSNIMSLLPDLTTFNADGNTLTGTIPPEFHELTSLSAQENQLSGTLDAAFFESTSLVFLDLRRNSELSLSQVPFVGMQWKVIGVGGTHVSGGFLSRVSVLPNLVFLDLKESGLSGTLPSEIGSMTSLTHLALFSNLLRGTIPSELQRLTRLQVLALQDNSLTGTIPSELGRMTELQRLIISLNKLSGGMPTELGLLTKVTALIFEDNNFEGTIPSEICSLKIDGVLEELGAVKEVTSWFYGGLRCPITDMPKCCREV